MEIVLKCDNCGAKLETSEAPARFRELSADATIMVVPCKACSDSAFDEGRKEGAYEEAQKHA